MKRKNISGITAIMMFATIFATPSIGFAANMNVEPEKNSTQTVETKEEKATKEAEEKETETKLEEKNSVQKKASVKATSSSEAAAVSDGVTGGSIYFDASTGTITDCDESVTAVVLPEKINGVDVISIGYDAFSDCIKLGNIVLPDSITSIETRAFENCTSLIKVKLSKKLEI